MHLEKKPKDSFRFLFFLGVILVIASLALFLVSCQSNDTATAQPTAAGGQTQPAGATESGPPPPTPEELWLTSAHANSYVTDDSGKNMICARCHSPINWIPSLEEMPESCFVCKFEVDPPPPLVAEGVWAGVSCKVCHKVKDGEVDPQYRWLDNAPLEEYVDVESTTELCRKCHTPVDVTDHFVFDVGGGHAGYDCTDCHDAHSTEANCSSAGCHEDVLAPANPIAGHDEAHQMVTCVACHDADNMEVGLDEEQGLWRTFPTISHNIITEAPCGRCHYPGNPWGLTEDVSVESP